MSNRTKSFFEQGPPAKQRPAQWHRQSSRPALNETSNNVAQPKPPIPATTKAKSKLKAFQFIPGRPGDPEPDVERDDFPVPPETGGAKVQDGSKTSATSLMTQPSESKTEVDDVPIEMPQLLHANTYPSTPAKRLPLEDLIGNFDETSRQVEVPEQSPEELIGWIPHSSSTLLTPNRKRKRARSSSPSCPNTSQRQEMSAFFGDTAAQADKKTPDIDPAVELWQRYGAKPTDGDGKMLDLTHLVFQASPKPLETPAKGIGLRRWASTGNDWPSSKSKRRRTNGKTNIHVWQEDQTAGHTGKSKVATMVEQLQESLESQKLASVKAAPVLRVEAPSSSSPLPETGAADALGGAPVTSPLQAKRPPTLKTMLSTTTLQKALQRPKGSDFSSTRHMNVNHDLEAASISPPQASTDCINPAPLHLQSKVPLPAYKRPSIGRAPSGGRLDKPEVVTPVLAAASAPLPVNDDLEDFGDDLDLSAEDFDELMTQPPPLHQTSLYQIPQHPNPPPQQHFNPSQYGSIACQEFDPAQSNPPIQIDDNEDEFGCYDIDEAAFVQAEITTTQGLRMSPCRRNMHKSRNPGKSKRASQSLSNTVTIGQKRLHRYVVKQIIDAEYVNDRGRRCPEKLVVGEAEGTSKRTAITFRDSWASTSVSPGNIIHIAHIPRFQTIDEPPSSPPGQLTVSDLENSPFVIVHPDHMLSATTVADSFDCLRKAVLQDRIKATSETNKSMVYGKILHEIFQQALSANRWDDPFLVDLVAQTLQNHLEGLWELGMKDTVLAVEEVRAKMGELASWARIFVNDSPSEVAVVDDKYGEKVCVSICKLIAIEEHIWSPQYGLKGNIDATVQMCLIDNPKEPSKKVVMPFEVKTGRTTQSPSHKAQTALYTLLLSDRYDVAVEAGILYYLESSAMSRIAPPLVEIRQMVQQRNRLASYIYRARHPRKAGDKVPNTPQTQEIEDSGLPALLKSPFKCGKCYARQSCFSYHALVENGTAETAGLVDDDKKNHSMVWQEAVGHLKLSAKDKSQAESLKQWFTKWDKLLTFEESELNRFRKELWTMSSAERESAGRCFGRLVIAQDLTPTANSATSSVVDGIEGSGGKINRFAYVFARADLKYGGSFTEGSQLTVGEPIVVSSEQGQWALANGYVTATSKHNITVAVDRRLGDARQRLDGFDEKHNQDFKGITTPGDKGVSATAVESTALYRLDKDEFSNGLALIRNNLIMLMSSHPIQTKLRDHIIFGGRPSFNTLSVQPPLMPTQIDTMNEDQRAAVHKVLSTEDFALILGMPGTGKTTTIAHIIRALLAEERTVLLTSFTHTAVDNILLKIRDIAPPDSILRLGVPAKINSEVQSFCKLAATPRKSIDDIEEAYMGAKIVATTCMGTNHALFNRRTFDVCIVDEASQITLPISLGPLLHARKFVLVGDHYQLPPLVQNKLALERGLDVSLFKQLSEEHPDSMAALGKQYRMCEDIMSLSNALIYNGQLKCGTDDVANRILEVKNPSGLAHFHAQGGGCSTAWRRDKCWLDDLTRPERKVIYANTDMSGQIAQETLTSGKNIANEFEATISAQLVLGLLALGVPAKEIGIITLYRSQLALMRQLFKVAGVSEEVEIDSADRFQGRDKECIILSMVRSNQNGVVGELLKDWRRVNVALTRARSKLIVLGSRQTLQTNDLLAKFLALVDEKGWATDLPKDADSNHTFNFSSQAASSLVARSTPSPSGDHAVRSPSKNVSGPTSSTKIHWNDPSQILRPSQNAGNRSPPKNHARKLGEKWPSKVIKGSSRASTTGRKMKEQFAMEIFEDLTADDI